MFVDTSVLVRYLTGDPPGAAKIAVQIIEESPTLNLTDVAIAETAFVLSKFYRYPRDVIVDALVELVRRRNIVPLNLDKGTVIDALLLCRPSGRVSFADAMIWAAARRVEAGVVYSFDQRFPSDGITLRDSL